MWIPKGGGDMETNDSGLETVDLGDVDELFRIGREVTFEPGQVIFEGGDEADSVFVVLEGEAQVDVGGRFHRLTRGDVFGEMGARPRQAAGRGDGGGARACGARSCRRVPILPPPPSRPRTLRASNAGVALARGRAADRRLDGVVRTDEEMRSQA